MAYNSVLKEYLRKVIGETIEEISEAKGEGTMLIVASLIFNDNKDKGIPIDKFLVPMDKECSQMEWRRKKSIKFLDKTLLRAMVIMDGATVIRGKSYLDATIEPRFIVYPHNRDEAFSILNINDLDIDLDVLKGKGSKHHGAANLSVLLVSISQNNSESLKKYLNSADGNLDLPFRIVTISADGPVKEWPNELKRR